MAGFSASATPANVPASTASRCAPARSARTVNATDDEHGDDRREVGLLRQPERLRQELIDPRVVIALDEVGDRDERRDGERGGAPDPCEATREPGADVVDRERRDRREHADLERGRQREELHGARAGDPRQRREQHRPAVPGERVADHPLAEQPPGCHEPDLVAALVGQPAVVVDREEQRDGREDLEGDDDRRVRRRRGARPRRPCGDEPRERPVGTGRRRRGAHGFVRSPDTRRPSARGPSRSGTAAREAEQLLGAGRVEPAARLPVRLRRVPADRALEPGGVAHQLGQVADRDLLCRCRC